MISEKMLKKRTSKGILGNYPKNNLTEYDTLYFVRYFSDSCYL